MSDRPRKSLPGLMAGLSGAPVLSVRRHKPDYWLLILAAMLLTAGLIVVYSISPALAASENISQTYIISKQLIDVSLGLLAFIIAAYLPSSWWWRIAGPIAALAILASIAVMFTPIDAAHPAHRWLKVGNFSFQVAELIKLATLVWVAKFLTLKWQSGRLSDFKVAVLPLLCVVIAVGLVVAGLQSDLGSAGVVVAIVGLMALVAGISLKKSFIILIVVAALVVMAVSVSPYRRERLSVFLNPSANCDTSAYQACQALVSIGSGGLMGLGLGHSVQAYGYQPEAGNDSIFAIIAEKFGFIGTIGVLLIYGALIARIKRVIDHTADQFPRLLTIGVLAWLSTQMIINAGAMLGLLPLKGITLPFISQGGTSLIFMTAALGMVFQISRYTSYSKSEPKLNVSDSNAKHNSSNRRRVGRAHNAPTFARPRG